MGKKGKEIQKAKKPWPTKDAMNQVYRMKLWGSGASDFYSGNGSHHPAIINPYIDELQSFLKSFDPPLTICDLGCGDFNVGKELVKYAKKYIAIDIVEDLIKYNAEKYKEDNLEFRCLDIAKDDLPVADCVLLRQVLQHLSNAEVHQIVNKLVNFKYVILTEHVPEENFIPNKDIISGQGIRLKKQSGINLLVEPFNLEIKEEKQLVQVASGNSKGVIVTTLYTILG